MDNADCIIIERALRLIQDRQTSRGLCYAVAVAADAAAEALLDLLDATAGFPTGDGEAEGLRTS